MTLRPTVCCWRRCFWSCTITHRIVIHRIVVPGYASTIIAVLVLDGTQLLALGIMGEYLGRLHLSVKLKPQYVERHVLAADRPVVSRDSAIEVTADGSN